jgi:hypothetical protein
MLHSKYNNSHSCGDRYLRSVKEKLDLKIAGTYCTARAARCNVHWRDGHRQQTPNV